MRCVSFHTERNVGHIDNYPNRPIDTHDSDMIQITERNSDMSGAYLRLHVRKYACSPPPPPPPPPQKSGISLGSTEDKSSSIQEQLFSAQDAGKWRLWPKFVFSPPPLRINGLRLRRSLDLPTIFNPI